MQSAFFLMTLYQCVKFHLIHLFTFRDILQTRFLLQTLNKSCNSVNTADRATLLALYTFDDGPLSRYQVSFNALVYFQRYAPDKLFIAKMKKENNPINTVDRVMILALGNSSHDPLSVHQVSFNYL